MPIGTPRPASAEWDEKPAGTVTTGEPVSAASIPLRPDCDGAPIFTTRFFCSGYIIASRLFRLNVSCSARVRLRSPYLTLSYVALDVDETNAVLTYSYCDGMTRNFRLLYNCWRELGWTPFRLDLRRYSSMLSRYSYLWVSSDLDTQNQQEGFSECFVSKKAPNAVASIDQFMVMLGHL